MKPAINKIAARRAAKAIAEIEEAPYFDAACPPTIEALGAAYERLRVTSISLVNALPSDWVSQINLQSENDS